MPKTSATFKYMPLERDAKGILRSALPVRLTHKTSVEFPALVDSGASGIFLPTSLANILGIENEGKPIQVRQVSGDNEGFEAIIRSVEILYNKEVFEVMRNQRIFVKVTFSSVCSDANLSSNVLISPFRKNGKKSP